MRVLGIEGTAHTCGVGIVQPEPDDPSRCRVLANRVSMLRPEHGGIHPREAAEHHVEALPSLLRDALDDAGIRMHEIDGIAFSQGPGLGPCLRTVATFARALALRHDKPIAGVNHCVAHLEIGRATAEPTDPVMLYASGGNTQVIAESAGRYRVFGETLDIGIGNALDKFARTHGIPFPGGPQIERLARDGRRLLEEERRALPELPYSVKGMDVAFSGLVNAAEALHREGEPIEVVCHALQEWAYAMLVEVTERALAHSGKQAVLLGGGVGRNLRLQEMLAAMAAARGASFHAPPGPLLSDNGAMIAWNGLLMLESGHPTPIAATQVDQTYRTDQVDLFWRANGSAIPARDLVASEAAPIDTARSDEAGGKPADAGTILARGAEATVTVGTFLGQEVIVKRRHRKPYRDPAIERRLVQARVRREVRGLVAAGAAGVPVPTVLDVDPDEGVIVQTRAPGVPLKVRLHGDDAVAERTFSRLGEHVARLHDAGYVHGDLTTSNVLLDAAGEPWLVDLGLSERTEDDEPRAVDLHVLQEALSATHHGREGLFQAFFESYLAHAARGGAVRQRYEDLVRRGRYRVMTG